MALVHRISVLTLSTLLAPTGAVESFSLRSLAKMQVGQPEPHRMDMINEMRAEKCSTRNFGVSDEYDECLKFMTGACNPGLDMLMNGSPGEITTGKGYCTNFFLNYKAKGVPQAGQLGGNAAVAPTSGNTAVAPTSGESLVTLPDDSPEEAPYPDDDDRVVSDTEEMEDVMEEVGELMKARSSNADEMKEDLAALNWYEDELQAKMDALNEDEYCRQVEKESVLVGQETSAPEMAEMLADMRCEMHRYSMPFYTKLMQKKLDEVREEQKELMLKIEARKQENRTKAVEEVAPSKTEKKEDAKLKAPAAPLEKASEGWSWWNIMVVMFVIACLVGAFLAGQRLKRWRSE